MNKLISFIFFFHFLALTIYAQSTVSFITPDTVCLDENILIQNTSSSEFNEFEWDFCAGDLEKETYQVGVLDQINQPYDIELLKDNDNWYAFVVNRGNRVYRINLGNNLESVNVDNLNAETSISSTDFKELTGLEMLNENGNWYGLVVSYGNNKLYRLDFGLSLLEEPTVVEISGGMSLNGPFDVALIAESDTLMALITNFNNGQLTEANFGNSITNVSVSRNFIVPSGSQLLNLSLIKDRTAWGGVITRYNSKGLHRIYYKYGLAQPPIIEQILGITLPNVASGISMSEERGEYYGFVKVRNGDLHRLDYGETFDTLNSVEKVDNLDGLSITGDGKITIVKNESKYYSFENNFSKAEIEWATFKDSCFSNTVVSSDVSLVNVSYSESGTYEISLTASDTEQNVGYATRSIIVKSSKAPNISIPENNNQCISNMNTFIGTGVDEFDITTWLWNFGDSTTTTGQEVTHQYDTAGIYEVTLEVEASNGCGQRITKPVTIYDPPEPDFSMKALGALCSNGTVSFTNQTNTQGADSLITYNWNFSGEDSTTTTSPEFVFTTGGDKTVTLTAAIPGCEASADTTFTVFEGPAVDFAFEDQCEGEAVLFENQTVGSNITQYQWDFGDGNTFSSTTIASPEHMFEAPGAYEVSLTVNDAQGCENAVVQTFRSFAKPEAAFTAELSCAGTPTLFTDETQIDASANVVLWQWDFGDETTGAATKNPEHVFAHPGTYAVQLLAETNEGCVDAVTQQLVVETPVQPGFEAIKICPSEALNVQLNDTSVVTGEETVTQWLWQVEDQIYQTQNPVHTFAAPGEYTVSLTATASSLCNASVTRTVTVLPLPEAGFSFAQACANEAVAFTDQSAYPESIANYTWDFGGAGTATDANPAFAFEEAGTYPVALMIEDIHGCTDTLTQSIDILPQPVAGFTVENTTGAAPFVVSFDNTSADASQYQWDFAGLDTSTAISPAFTFEEAGTYPVQLSVANAIGCADTLLRTFTVVQPVFNVSLDNITLQPATSGGASTNIILTVSNPGTLPVQGFHVAVDIDKQLALERNFGSTLEPGGTFSFPLGVAFSQINHAEGNTRYVCATLTPLEDNFAEAEKGDNIFCLNIDETFYSLPPFPNPVQGLVEIPLILPIAEVVDITMATPTGHILQSYTFSDLQVGLNTLQLDVRPFPTGVYVLTIRYQGRQNTYRLVINP